MVLPAGKQHNRSLKMFYRNPSFASGLRTLLVIMMTLKSSDSVCNTPGWFGERCAFQCHCIDNKNCNRNGDCSDGCSTRWFGPQCQYRSSKVHVTVDGKPNADLTDNNISTCLDNSVANGIVNVTLLKPHPLVWFRLGINDADHVSPIDFSFESDENTDPNLEPKLTQVDESTVDVQCETTYAIKRIKIFGKGVSHLCSIDVSLGRNVALRQETSQSSTLDIWASSNAVDGSLGPHDNRTGQAHTCTHTNYETVRHTWTLKFPRGVKITRIDIYNRINRDIGNCCEERLKGFSLTAYDKTFHAFTYIDQEPEPLDIYFIVPQKRIVEHVDSITITSALESEALTLCEVQVFGDIMCPSGFYGRDCENKCNCVEKSEPCYEHSGSCLSGCKPGFTGPGCSTPCADGTYGVHCKGKCSAFCKFNNTRSCDSKTGSCDGGCQVGYLPPLCDKLNCTQGSWFGKDCKLKCHCKHGDDFCNKVDGQCFAPNGASDSQGNCIEGFFGPSCQYRYAKWVSTKYNPTPDWLKDNNDATCNDGYQIGFFRQSFKWPFITTWFRLVARNIESMTKLDIHLTTDGGHGSVSCFLNHSALIDENTRDYNCPSYTAAETIVVIGANLSQICGLYFSIGRNVALRQSAKASSVDRRAREQTGEKAVDGTVWTSQRQTRNCVQTAREPTGSTVTITFSSAVDLVGFGISTRRDCCRFRMLGFHMMLYSGTDEIYHYRDTNWNRVQYWTFAHVRINETLPSPVTSFTFKTLPWKIVEACEIYAYGDIACPNGKYGRQCEKKCNCRRETDSCIVPTGGCPTGCRHGFTGVDCNQRCEDGMFGIGCTGKCSDKCVGGPTSCSSLDGTCLLGCLDGYEPPNCVESCEQGWYGANCDKLCSTKCKGGYTNCDSVTGDCKEGCEYGYQEPYCISECNTSTYGWRCLTPCDESCVNQLCHHVTGHCLDCPPGLMGDFCEEDCLPTLYGTGCAIACSETCLNSSCHPVTGSCLECPPGMIGKLCNKVCDLGFYGTNCTGVCSDYCEGGYDFCDSVDGICQKGCEPLRKPPLCKEVIVIELKKELKMEKKREVDPQIYASAAVVGFIFLLYVIAERYDLSMAQRAARMRPDTGGDVDLFAWLTEVEEKQTQEEQLAPASPAQERKSSISSPQDQSLLSLMLDPSVQSVATETKEMPGSSVDLS